MGLTALVGVLAGGAVSDRLGPILATVIAFAARIVVFALILIDQSPLSVAIFALVFGATFMVTAPLTVLFVRDAFGTKPSRRAHRPGSPWCTRSSAASAPTAGR